MFKKSRSRWGLFALVLVLSLAFAAMTTASAITGPAGTLRLHVANGSGVFTYTPTSGAAQTQDLVPNKCVIRNPVLAGNLVDMTGTATGTAKPVGLVGSSIGIKGSSSATGTPCGRVDAAETMTLTLGDIPNAGSVELDLELKGGAKVEITFMLGTETVGVPFQIRSGSSIVVGQGKEGNNDGPPFTLSLDAADNEIVGNCRNASDSGPDSGGNDNCRVSIIPAGEFDTVTFTTLAGEFSLEGGGDAGTSDTVFNLVATFEGELGCPSTGNNVAFEGAVAKITRHENTDGSVCVPKPYNLTAESGVGGDSVTFDVSDPAAQKGAYEADLTFAENTATLFDASLSYDPTAPYDFFVDMPPCVQDPFDLEPSEAGSINDEAIPSPHKACVVSVDQTWDGTTVWHIVFTADIKFR